MFKYTFVEFEEVFDELIHRYERINLQNEEKISNLNVTNEFFKNAKLELEKKKKKLKMDFRLCEMNLNDVGNENEQLRNALKNYKKKID